MICLGRKQHSSNQRPRFRDPTRKGSLSQRQESSQLAGLALWERQEMGIGGHCPLSPRQLRALHSWVELLKAGIQAVAKR